MKIRDVQFDKDNLFFTADTHFGHTNIINFCNRPFRNSIEMNQELVKRWNEKVPKDAIVFHLGDFALKLNSRDTSHILNSLNGKKYLVIGNHEKCALAKEYIKSLWEGVYDIAEIFVNDEEVNQKKQHLVMCHYAMKVWNGSHRGSWQLFGHSHGTLKDCNTAQMDVGVDTHNFKPYSYQEIKELLMKKNN